MDFFKSVFQAEPDPSDRRASDDDEQDEEEEDQHHDGHAADGPSANPGGGGGGGGGGAWDFGGLIKTITTKSESVIQTYRRDLEEFGSGLKKETAAIREAAARAVLDLPGSLEAGASVAQESIESVGQAIDDIGGTVWRGTTEIISHGKDALLSIDAANADTPDPPPPGSAKRYTRFEAQVLAIQSDPATFEEPEDGEGFRKWKDDFDLGEKEEEIDNICYENGTLEGLFAKLVPGAMDYDTFWSRYYYRVYKLKQAEDARANLVKRAIERDEEEELSWEVDDDEEEEIKEEEVKHVVVEENKGEIKDEEKERKEDIIGTSENVVENKPVEAAQVEKKVEVVEVTAVEQLPPVQEKADDEEPNGSDSTTKSEVKVEPGESGKDSDFSVVSSQPSMPEEDDLGWDEIEDLGEHDEKKVSGSGGSAVKLDPLKRLSAAEEDEDLSWDTEDDDEPAKP